MEIQIHALLAIVVGVLSVATFCLKRGTGTHRWMGWTWIVLMALVGLSRFAIHEIRPFGPSSPIHILSGLVLYQLVVIVRLARSKSIPSHARCMKMLTLGALVGAFAFLPGRIMYQVVIGG